MRTTVQRWGNSLAVRIPKAFASQAELVEDSRVDIALQKNAIVIRAAPAEWKLDELLQGVTAANRHHETEWGGAEGDESW